MTMNPMDSLAALQARLPPGIGTGSGRAALCHFSRQHLARNGRKTARQHSGTVADLWRGCAQTGRIWTRLSSDDRRLHALKRACARSEEHTSELQSLMRISYAVFCLKKKKNIKTI